jgi:hypothetical protein
MKVLVGCERSARVRDAFRARGHDAWSCDLQPTDGDPRWHVQGDVTPLLEQGCWDLGIFFPDCQHLAAAGARWWPAKQADGRQGAALDFIRLLMAAPIPRVAIENPVGKISTEIRRPDQIIAPWMWGEPYLKQTCLWLENLPLLVPDVAGKPDGLAFAVSGGVHSYDPAAGRRLCVPGSSAHEDSEGRVNRQRVRSRTFAGIAEAMSAQWG